MQSHLGAIEFDPRLMGWDSDDVAQRRVTSQDQAMA